MMTILEYIWTTNEGKMLVFRLMGLGLLSGALVEAILGVRLPEVERVSPFEYLMRAPAYRRFKGGALRQVRFE